MNVRRPSLETASLLLHTVDRYEVHEEGSGLVGPSIVAKMYDAAVLGQVFVRFAFAGDITAADIDHWSAHDPSGGSLRILVRPGEGTEIAESLCSRAASRGRHGEVRRWEEFYGGILQLSRIEAEYTALRAEYEETEGAGFRYIDQRAVVDDGQWERLLGWALDDGREPTGVTYVIAEYGEGKTSFCLNYVFGAIERARRGGPVPLLFNLNEFEAGNIKAFLEKRLRDDYGLELSFAGFRELCRHGVLVPVLDAFDQMHNGDAGPARIERDHGDLMQLGSEVSPLYVTCRMNFFDQHVRELRGAGNGARPFRLVVLRGFDQDDVKDALGEGAAELSLLLADPANQEVLANIHHKPLMLHVILSHPEPFAALIAARRQANADSGEVRPVKEYDVFNLLYTTWLKDHDFVGMAGAQEANALMRMLAGRVQLEGMNQPVLLSYLKRSERFHDLVDSPEAAERLLIDLARLPLLNHALLRRDDATISFRFNAYLEFLTARFVLDELTPRVAALRELIKQNPLTWETRQMIAPNLSVEEHGEAMKTVVERSRHEAFTNVKFEASNVLTLILDCIQHPGVTPSERIRWRTHLKALRLAGTQLRRLDARGADLVEINFSDADLRDADFSFAVLRGANLSSTSLDGATFKEAGAVLTTVFVSQSEDDLGRWRLAGGTENGMVVLWDSTSSYPTRTWLHNGEIKALGAAGRDDPILSVALDGSFGETDPASPQVPLSYPLGAGGLRAMAVAPDGSVIVGGDLRTLIVLDDENRERHRLSLPAGQRAVVTALAVDADEHRLYAGDGDGDLYLFTDWRRPTTAELATGGLGGEIQRLSIMRDGTLLAVVAGAGAVTLAGPGDMPATVGRDRPAASADYAAAADTIVWHDGHAVFRQRRNSMRADRIGELPDDIGPAILSTSADASFVAVGGNRIVVWHEGFGGVEQLLNEPMRMDCTGTSLADCTGLGSEQEFFLENRGATF